MKTAFAVLFLGALSTTMALAQGGDPGAEERFHMKFGRPSPNVEARLKAAQADTAQRRDAQIRVTARNDGGAEERFRTKFGRPSRISEVRQREARTGTASRSEPAARMPDDAGAEQRFRMKFGRPSPLAESRANGR